MKRRLVRRMNHLRGDPKLRKQRQHYHAIFYDRHTGKRKWVALGTKRKEVAARRFRDLVRAYEAGEFDPFGESAQVKPLTFEEAATLFVAFKRKEGRRPKTLYEYENFLSRAARLLPAGLMLRDLEEDDARRIVQRPRADASRRAYYRNLKVFLRWCVKKGHLDRSPLEHVPMPYQAKRPPIYLKRSDLEHLLSVIEAHAEDEAAPIVHLATRLAVSTGLRLNELVHLRCGDVEPETGLLYVRSREDFTTKNGNDRSVPLSPASLAVYHECRGDERAPEEPLLTGVRGGQLYGHWLSRRFKGFVRKAGLGEEIKFHTLRHTFASWLAAEGVDPHRIKSYCGHGSLTTTEVYLHLQPQRTDALNGVFFDLGGSPEKGARSAKVLT